jgi:thioredoxin-related protein
MRKLLLFILSLAVALGASAVQLGDTLASVLEEKGEPRSRLERGNVIMLTYEDGSIRLENGVVVMQTLPGSGRSERPAPARGTGGRENGPGMLGEWTTDYQLAVDAARGTRRSVLLFFTGSDWCGWCKRLEAEVLDTEEFKTYASGNLVLVKLDFRAASHSRSSPSGATVSWRRSTGSRAIQRSSCSTTRAWRSAGSATSPVVPAVHQEAAEDVTALPADRP